MDSYLDIRIRPDEEVPLYFIRNKIFSKLHKALYDQNQTKIGVSFPDYKTKLGEKIRLHGEVKDLEALQKLNWIGGLIGYCEIGEILSVPEKVKGYRTISRIRQNMSNAKLNRLIKRGTITEDKVEAYKIKMIEEGLDNPYLELQSKSSGENYRIYLAFGDVQKEAETGKFNHFGLSKTATIPWF